MESAPPETPTTTLSPGTNLDVYSPKDGKDILSRKLFLSPEGDVRGEVYYDSAGRSATEIQRYDFLEIPGQSGSFRSIIYPKKITIISPETQKGTALFFSNVKAQDTIDPLEFLLRLPPGTKEVFLDEKGSRSPASKKSENAVRLQAPKRATPPLPAPVPPVKEVPVYYAKPREVPEEKAVPHPVVKAEKRAAVKKPTGPRPAAPASAPATTSNDKNVSKEADLVGEEARPVDQTSPAYDQGSLDPSVEPTA